MRKNVNMHSLFISFDCYAYGVHIVMCVFLSVVFCFAVRRCPKTLVLSLAVLSPPRQSDTILLCISSPIQPPFIGDILGTSKNTGMIKFNNRIFRCIHKWIFIYFRTCIPDFFFCLIGVRVCYQSCPPRSPLCQSDTVVPSSKRFSPTDH